MDDISDPTLKQARAEIEEVMRRHRISGVVSLHTFYPAPTIGRIGDGRGETFAYIADVPYLRLHLNESGELRMRSRRSDYPSAEAQAHDLAGTVNLVEHFGMSLGTMAMAFIKMDENLSRYVKREGPPGQFQRDPPKGAH
jgi:hypothetical protein